MITSIKVGPIAAAMTAVFVLVAGLSACNTVEGAGQDIKSTGKAIERSADGAK